MFYVSLSKKSLDEGKSIERFQIFKVLAISNEDNRTFGCSNSRQSSSSLGVTVHLGDDNWAYIDSFPEGLGLSIALLTDGAVHDKDDVVGADSFLNLFHFIKELGFLFVSTWGIDDDDFHALVFELGNSFFGDGNWVSFDVASVEGNSYLGCVLFQLIEGSSSEGIGANHGDSPAFLFVVVCYFTASGCFSTALKSDKHDDVDFSSFGFEGFLLNFEEAGQFLDDGLFDENSEVATALFFIFELIENILSQFHDILDIDIAAQECVANLFEAFFDGFFIDDGGFIEFLEGRGDLSSEVS